MDYTPIIQQVVNTLWWVFPILLVITLFKTPLVKGWIGEAVVNLMGRIQLPRYSYHRLQNVTLPITDNDTTQIDHIIVSQFGVFVVETKHMKGWIFGSERQAEWTQKIYRKSYRFQNPLRQNYKHVKALEAVLDIPAEHIHSVVVFVGDNRFKTKMPANVTRGPGYVRYIRSFRTPVFTESKVQQIVQQITSTRLAQGWETNKQHVAQLQKRRVATAVCHEQAVNQPPACSKCGKTMILRTARKGTHAGQKFWGCSGFPNCRSVRVLDS